MKVKNMALGNTLMQMDLLTTGSGKRIKSMVLAHRPGQTEKSTMDNGETMTWMAMGSTSMQTRFDMMVSLSLTRNKALDVTFGQMDVDTKVGGTKVSNMVMGHITQTKTSLRRRVSGRTESDLNGSLRRKSTKLTKTTLICKGSSKIQTLQMDSLLNAHSKNHQVGIKD